MKTAGRVVVVGTLNVDLIWQVPVLPRPGQTIIAAAVQRQFGGKGANQAVAAARQGAQVALVGAVGDDADGSSYCAYLRQEGIDVALIATIVDMRMSPPRFQPSRWERKPRCRRVRKWRLVPLPGSRAGFSPPCLVRVSGKSGLKSALL